MYSKQLSLRYSQGPRHTSGTPASGRSPMSPTSDRTKRIARLKEIGLNIGAAILGLIILFGVLCGTPYE